MNVTMATGADANKKKKAERVAGGSLFTCFQRAAAPVTQSAGPLVRRSSSEDVAGLVSLSGPAVSTCSLLTFRLHVHSLSYK